MKIFVALMLALAVVSGNFFVGEEDGIMILDSETFDNAIGFYDNLIVEFYAEWCSHCKRFLPKFKKACEVLKTLDTPIYCAKIDGDLNKDIAEKKYKVSTFPTVKYFKNGEVIDYDGAFNEHALLSWVKTGKAESTIEIDATDLDRMTQSEDVFWVFFGDTTSKEYNQFNMISKFDENRLFFHSSDQSIIDKYEIQTPTMVAFRRFDEPVVKLEEKWDRLAVMNFIRESGKAKCMRFKEIDKTNIFKAKDRAIFLFVDENRDQGLIDTFCEVANSDDSPMMYAYAGIEDFEHTYLRKYLNLHEREVPIMAGVKWEVAYGMMRYEYDGDVAQLTKDDILGFKRRFRNGALERHFYDDHEDTWYHLKAPVNVIYDEYEQVVLDDQNDVLVYYFSTNYEDNNKHQKYAEQLSHLQAEVARPDHFIVGRYEWHKSPPVHQDLDLLFGLWLFPIGNKDQGIKYEGDGSVDDIKHWLNKHSTEFQKLYTPNDDL